MCDVLSVVSLNWLFFYLSVEGLNWLYRKTCSSSKQPNRNSDRPPVEQFRSFLGRNRLDSFSIFLRHSMFSTFQTLSTFWLVPWSKGNTNKRRYSNSSCDEVTQRHCQSCTHRNYFRKDVEKKLFLYLFLFCL